MIFLFKVYDYYILMNIDLNNIELSDIFCKYRRVTTTKNGFNYI